MASVVRLNWGCGPDPVPGWINSDRIARPGVAPVCDIREGLPLPDLDRAIRAYLAGDAGYFYIPDGEMVSIGGKLVVQAIWYGSVRTPFTWELAEEFLARCAYRQSPSPWAPDIRHLDNRPRESLFVEAVK